MILTGIVSSLIELSIAVVAIFLAVHYWPLIWWAGVAFSVVAVLGVVWGIDIASDVWGMLRGRG